MASLAQFDAVEDTAVLGDGSFRHLKVMPFPLP